MSVCRYHADRSAIGLCMRCRGSICAACCTQLDGINHCHACLKSMAARPAQVRSRPFSALVATGLLFVGAWAVLFGLLLLAQGGLAP